MFLFGFLVGFMYMYQEYTVDLSGVFALVECSMCQMVTNTSSPFEYLTLILPLTCVFPPSVNTKRKFS